MENNPTTIDSLITHAEDYVKTRQELTQHVIAEKVIVLSASMITAYVLFVFFLLAAFFASWGLATWISQRMNDALAGYWVVSVGYAALGVVFLFLRNVLVRNPVMNSMVRNIYSKQDGTNN